MQPDQPLLTIAIPTYNREQYLKTLLYLLEPQVLDEPRLELIISDNASTDGTESMVQAFSVKNAEFRYIKNKANLGMDGNFIQCFEQARGKYVWVLGDDDIVAPDAIRKIMAWLESGEYDLIYISSFPFEGAYDFCRTAERKEPSRITNVRNFSRQINVFFTFISGNIVNKNRVLAGPPLDFSPLIGTSLVQMSWMYAALNGYACGLYVHERLVGARINNTGGYKLLQTFGPTLKRITENLLDDKALQCLIINGTIMRFWPSMLISYKVSLSAFEYETSPQEVLGLTFPTNFRYWIFIYPIIIGPLLFDKAWFRFIRAINMLDKLLGYPLMR